MSEALVLGRFVPVEFSAPAIESGLRSFLPQCCRGRTVGVRVPLGLAPNPDNLQWHQDDHGPRGEYRHLTVWASEQPTELRLSTGELFQAEPFDVVRFDNHRVFHRQPTGTDETRRWFAAVRCAGEAA